jgi:hypothetical protein
MAALHVPIVGLSSLTVRATAWENSRRQRQRPVQPTHDAVRCSRAARALLAGIARAAHDSSSGAVSGTVWATTTNVRVARVCGPDAHCTCGAIDAHRIAPTASRATVLGGATQPPTASDSSSAAVHGSVEDTPIWPPPVDHACAVCTHRDDRTARDEL